MQQALKFSKDGTWISLLGELIVVQGRIGSGMRTSKHQKEVEIFILSRVPCFANPLTRNLLLAGSPSLEAARMCRYCVNLDEVRYPLDAFHTSPSRTCNCTAGDCPLPCET